MGQSAQRPSTCAQYMPSGGAVSSSACCDAGPASPLNTGRPMIHRCVEPSHQSISQLHLQPDSNRFRHSRVIRIACGGDNTTAICGLGGHKLGVARKVPTIK
eukprot:scaffold58049_cov65-Phaeocystis_antarctica.AAC.2